METALFGGTFDPVHDGHLAIAGAAAEECGLGRVVFLPCFESPHKKGERATAGHHRLRMLQLATRALPWAEVSNWELLREKPSYSWETAEHFASEVGDLHWILGADQWNALDRWARPERLAELLRFIVFPRNGLPLEPREGFRATFLTAMHPASATEIRRRGGCSPHLDEAVSEYAAKHRLYPKPPPAT